MYDVLLVASGILTPTGENPSTPIVPLTEAPNIGSNSIGVNKPVSSISSEALSDQFAPGAP